MNPKDPNKKTMIRGKPSLGASSSLLPPLGTFAVTAWVQFEPNGLGQGDLGSWGLPSSRFLFGFDLSSLFLLRGLLFLHVSCLGFFFVFLLVCFSSSFSLGFFILVCFSSFLLRVVWVSLASFDLFMELKSIMLDFHAYNSSSMYLIQHNKIEYIELEMLVC